jgi:hypothetical protein
MTPSWKQNTLVHKKSICDDHTSDEHIKNRKFNPDTSVLSILEGFRHENGIIAEAFVTTSLYLSASTGVCTNAYCSYGGF